MGNKMYDPKKNLYKEIASYCGVTERYIRMIDQKERTPSMETARKIAQFFDKSVDDIFFSNKSNFKFFLASLWFNKCGK
ncbi:MULTISPECIES: helix-turn-helix transcriptional regulator [Bacillus cereus group]|uniref:helix-turn-helix transcriptional regulator n=1 Tax=Bacillus TaxID=1386 RepID=UPI001F46C8B1|nr:MULTISPECIES: helix-turn-helix transcriptional regulator [Bacillus cereus group]MCE9753994.1 helix-turn-helix transcriptional regulator [Bacillus cereus]MDC7729593.1 helix-turn-helix transcriptional regulator [Bacillus cereus]MDZ4411960.1 helix-turn-helix transcriptional regulator [Bacillus cereus]MDZ4588302.1 helix-turn-helix transcriptional regulator [Bacillus cereus]MDZ4599776.1 helix-turn-helix transcriptional regulator [Bacillus cereus]